MKIASSSRWLKITSLTTLLAAPIFYFGHASAEVGTQVAVGPPQVLQANTGDYFLNLIISRDGSTIAVAGNYDRDNKKLDVQPSGTVFLWDPRSLTDRSPFSAPVLKNARGEVRGNGTSGLVLSPDGKDIGFCRDGEPFALYRLATRDKIWSAQVSTEHAQFSSDGRLIGLIAQGKCEIYDADNGHVVASWSSSPSSFQNDIAFSPDQQWVASVGSGLPFEQWTQNPNASGGNIELRRRDGFGLVRTLLLNNTQGISFSPDSRFVVGVGAIYGFGTAQVAAVIRCFDLSTGKIVWEQNTSQYGALDGGHFCCNEAVFSPDGKVVAVRFLSSKIIRFLDAHGGHEVGQIHDSLPEPWNNVSRHAMVFSADGKRLFVRRKNSILVWELNPFAY